MNSLKKASMAFILIIFMACSNSSSNNPDLENGLNANVNQSEVKSFIVNYMNMVLFSYRDSLAASKSLENSIQTFLKNPNSATLNAAKNKWIAAREFYSQTEAYRFYSGPIDNDTGPEGFLNGWPLDESTIDYVEGNLKAGIINNLEIELTKDNLIQLNEQDGETALTTGFHAVEFLLWGQDLNQNVEDAGRRLFSDYVLEGAENPEVVQRRRDYLTIVSGLIVEHLQYLVDQWEFNNPENYRAEFANLPYSDALKNIITGMGTLASAELAGERISVAMFAQDQEDEQSCFSDNTHRDLFNNFKGVQNIYFGTFERLNGSIATNGGSLQSLIFNSNPELESELTDLIGQAEILLNEVSDLAENGIHFDQQILESNENTNQTRTRLDEITNLLFEISDLLIEASSSLGIEMNFDEVE